MGIFGRPLFCLPQMPVTVRRSYIAIHTCSFIDKSEHLTARGLRCCLATLGQRQGLRHLWMGLRAPVLHRSYPSWGAHPIPCVAWALLWGPRSLHRARHGSVRVPGGRFRALCLALHTPHPASRPVSAASAWHTPLPRPPGSTFQSISDAILGGGVCATAPVSCPLLFWHPMLVHPGAFHLVSCVGVCEK